MSSILRALKKLEEDSLSPEQGVIVPQKKLKQVVGRRVSRRLKAPRVLKWSVSIGMAAILVLVGAVLWNVFTAKSGPTPGSAPLAASEPEKNSPPEPKVAKAQPVTISPAQPEPSVNVPVNTPVNADNRQELTRQQEVESPGLTNDTAATPPTGEPAPTPALPTKPMLPNLVLNGVLWSDNPERRVALINNRYLREGDSIDGVSVVKIEKKAVTLQSGTEKWTITVQK